jgi:hypothetical protein
MDTVKEKIRIEVTKACAATWNNAINDLSGKGSIQNGMYGTVDAIMEIIKQHFIISVEEVASIIHKGIYEKDISEEFPVRNLHIYAIAKMICDKQMGGANEIPKM